MKVNFIILGAMKCGTTSLATILREHPDIVFSSPKEPQFFSRTDEWRENLDEYHAHFERENDVLYGEGSTTYTKYPNENLEIWKDIYDYNPDMKFIYVIRDPVDRAISHYMHLYTRRVYTDSIEKCIINYPKIIRTGCYFTQIKPFVELFGKDNVLIVRFNKLIYETEEVLGDISGLLDLSPFNFKTFDDIHRNKTIGVKNEQIIFSAGRVLISNRISNRSR